MVTAKQVLKKWWTTPNVGRVGAGTGTSTAMSIHSMTRAGIALIVILVFGSGGWAMISSISGAVIAPGRVAVETASKKVQHKEGGIVKEIHVKNGDSVRSGDLLARLDGTVAKANLYIVQKQLDERLARLARLEAERDQANIIAYPLALTQRQDNSEVAALLSGEQAIFDARQQARAGQKKQLKERTHQLSSEIDGLRAQAAAKKLEMKFIEKELAGLNTLFEKGLVANTRILALEREKSRLLGEQGSIAAQTARAHGQISEINLQVIQLDRDFLSSVVDESRDISSEIAELQERAIAAEDEMRRLEIRAPQDGYIHQMSISTIGGVIGPGETIMLVVPSKESLIVEGQVLPADIDQIYLSQPVILRFAAFNQRTSPEINAYIDRISPDLTTDPETGLAYYVVHIRMTDAEVQRLGQVDLVPGMPVEVFIQTGSRSAMSYLLKPLADQIHKTFREE